MAKKLQVFLASLHTEHRGKFIVTLLNPVLVNTLPFRLLPNSLKNENEIRIWGFPSSNKNFAVWNKVSKNDWFFFDLNGRYSYACQTLGKLHSSELAHHLWKLNHSLDKMDLMVIFSQVSEISMGFLRTNRMFGIEASIPSIHRIILVQAEQESVDKLLQKYKTMDNFLRIRTPTNLPDHTRLGKIIPSDIKEPPAKFKSTTIRFIRDTQKSAALKKLYDDKCQICEYTISIADSQQYSEVHHVWPLGEGGIDDFDNMIVLCPNHHAEFDYATIGFHDIDYSVIIDKNGTTVGKMRFRREHSLDSSNVEYHRTRMEKNTCGP